LRETMPVRHWLEPTKKVADVTAMTVRPLRQQFDTRMQETLCTGCPVSGMTGD
jgi:hypothetical protein